jgi:hypothetical protein
MPAPGGGASDTLWLPVENPAPALTSLTPVAIDGLRDTVITATGSGFTLASLFWLRLDTTIVPIPVTTVLSPTEVRLTIPAALIATLGTYHVSVFNPTPGGGTSAERDLSVQAGAPVSVEFLNVTTAIVAGESLAGVQIRLRDAAGFLSDLPASADSLYAIRQPDAILNTPLPFGLPLARVSAGLYDVSPTPLTTAGTYRLALDSVPMAGISTLIGNRSFSVQPNVRANVWIEFLNATADFESCGCIYNRKYVFTIQTSTLLDTPDAPLQILPNPATEAATIYLSLPASSPIRLTLHDALGREVRTVAEGIYAAGVLGFSVSLDGLPSGIYFVRANVGGQVLVRRLALVR